jgi:heptosyltransferase-1
LHLGAMCGARAIGWYFSRARVHETGPYGIGHYVWQHERRQCRESVDESGERTEPSSSDNWPVMETVNLMVGEQVSSTKNEWALWTSHRDEWGVFYTRDDKVDEPVLRRKDTWKTLSHLPNCDLQMEVSR